MWCLNEDNGLIDYDTGQVVPEEQLLTIQGFSAWGMRTNGVYVNYVTGETADDIAEVQEHLRLWTNPIIWGYCNATFSSSNVPYSRDDYMFTKYIAGIECVRDCNGGVCLDGLYNGNGVVRSGNKCCSLLEWVSKLYLPSEFYMPLYLGGYAKFTMKDGYKAFMAKVTALRGGK